MTAEFDFDASQNEPKATNQDILNWIAAKSELAKAKAREATLRALIIKTFFPTPDEGTNTFELGNDYKLKYGHKLSREIDDAMLTNLLSDLREAEVNVDNLVERKPSLKIANWRKLSEEQAKVFNQCVTTKPASGTLEFVKPKGVE